MLRFTEDHEWVRLDVATGIATVGVTPHAVEQLGDLVFVELPEVGATLARQDGAATVESVKAASDVYAPLAGEVVAVNAAIVEDPSKVNADPLGEGWFFKLRLADAGAMAELLDEAAYAALTG